MSTLITDFREYRRGRLPSDWTERWTTGGDSLIEGASIDLSHRSVLQLNGSPSPTTRLALSWDAADVLAIAAASNDGEMYGRMRLVTAAGGHFGGFPILRGSGAAGSENGYRLVFFDDGTWWLGKWVAGVHTVLSIQSRTFHAGSIIHFRFGVLGTTVRARVWTDGDPEPSTWTPDGISIVSVTDTSHASGWRGFQLPFPYVASRSEVQVVSVSTGADSAPLDTTLPPALDTWIMEPDEDLEITARLEYYNPVSDSVEETWVSSLGRTTGPVDYPPSASLKPLLADAGSITRRLEADTHLAGLILPALQPLTFHNLPDTISGAGLLDGWPDLSFYGRPVELRIGRRWATRPTPLNPAGVLSSHRTFEIISCAVAAQEPDVGLASATLPLGNPDHLLQSRIPVYHNVGITTGVEILTATGWLRVPSSASYDLSSFSIYLRVYIPSTGVAGSSFATLSRRQTDLTHRQWHIAYYQSSHVTLAGRLHFLSYDAGGNAIISFLPPLTYYPGRFIDVIFTVIGGDRWYAVVEDEVVGSGILSANPTIASGQPVEILAPTSTGLKVCDHRIEMFAAEDDALSRFTARYEPDSLTVSMHRCDETSGSGVTDYAPLANHGTLQGVENTDYSRAATYLGSIDLAGTPMPFSGGILYNAPAQQIDPVSEVFRHNDRDLTPGATLQVRAKGALLTAGVAYTEPAAGVMDISGASDQPVTFGYTPTTPVTPEDPRTHVPRLATDELLARGALSLASLDADSFYGLRQLLPFKGGFSYPEPPTTADFLSRLLGNSGAFYNLDPHGRIAAGCMLPPANPGPYGHDYLLEFLGLPSRGVTLHPHSSYSLTQNFSWSLSCWIKLHGLPVDRSSSLGTYFPSGMTMIDRVDTASGAGYYLGFDGRDGSIIFGAPGVTSTTSGLDFLSFFVPLEYEEWYLIQGYQDLGTRIIFVTKAGTGNSASVGSLSELTTGTMTDAVDKPILIGHGPQGSLYGAIQYAIGSSHGRDQLTLATMTETRPTVSNSLSGIDRFFLSLADGGGDIAREEVQGRDARIEGARWCPRSIFDLRRHAIPTPSATRRPIPAWRVETRYRENLSPLSGANVAAGVSATDRLSLGRSYLSVPGSRLNTRENYLSSRDIALDTPFYSSDAAAFLSTLLRTRIGTGSTPSGYVESGFVESGFISGPATLGPRFMDVRNWPAEVLRLNLTDEVIVYFSRFGMDVGVAARVAGLVARLSAGGGGGSSAGPAGGGMRGDVTTWSIG